MCKHADETKIMINHLLEEVYPLLALKIKYALECNHLQHSLAPEKQVMNDLMTDIKNEFQSLVTYEQKLVFPSVLKIFLATKEQDIMPNLGDLLQLTKSKEHKLMHKIRRLALMLEDPQWDIEAQSILAKAFLTNFTTEKLNWYKMIENRTKSCSCFKKNYFKLEKSYKTNSILPNEHPFTNPNH